MARVIVVSFFLMLFGLVSPALGHPPSEILLEFDIAEHLLKVTIVHAVSDSSKHYADRITVELKGEKMIEQKFKSQSDRKTQVAEYRLIDAQLGDEIVVTAVCNISGQKKAKLKVEQKGGEQDAPKQPSEEK